MTFCYNMIRHIKETIVCIFWNLFGWGIFFTILISFILTIQNFVELMKYIFSC